MASDKKENIQTPYAELLDIPSVTLAEAKEQVMLSLKSKQRRGCIVLVGESGLGKTQIFDQIAADEGCTVRKIHTAHWGLMGSGIPRKAEGEFFKVAVPDIFPRQGERSILLFDELNRGLKHAIAMFFTMLEDGTMFNYTLPDECLVVGTMNPSTAQYAVTNIENEPAIRRRVKFLWVIPEVNGFLKHASSERFHTHSLGPAKGKPCHPEILSFFRAHQKLIYDLKAQKANKQYCNPAAIETISEDAWNIEAEGKHIGLDSDFAQTRFGASIGVTLAAQLSSYLKDNTVMIKPEDVIFRFSKAKRNLTKLLKKEKHEIISDLCDSVLSLLFTDTPDVTKAAENFLKFCTLIPGEMAANMLFQMKEVAHQSNSTNYLGELMAQLQDYEEWIQLQLLIDEQHREVDGSVRAT